MAQKIFVTDAQVKAARMLVDRDRALGRETDEATRIIADQDLDDDPAPSARRPDYSWAAASRRGTSFWAALDTRQQDQLTSVGTWRTFPAGAVLMGEGDPADHVIVILGGRAKISVSRDGRERVLAVRGLGELIGERAAQGGSVRSATVTAIEMVWGLVVQAKDFAAFTVDHPHVMNILQDQLYAWLTAEPLRSVPGAGGWRRFLRGTARSQAPADLPGHAPETRRPRHPDTLNGEHCTVVLSDVVGFGAGSRTDDDRAVIRKALLDMMNAALKGISDVRTEDRGDGLLTVLPPAVPTEEIMRRLFAELPAALERHNRDQRDSVRFQLRLAVNVGPVSSDADGVSGEAVNIATKLLIAPQFKKATAAQAASLGVIVSPFVYETVVRPDPDLTEVASYTEVPVEVKESNTTAWVRQVSRDPVTA